MIELTLTRAQLYVILKCLAHAEEHFKAGSDEELQADYLYEWFAEELQAAKENT